MTPLRHAKEGDRVCEASCPSVICTHAAVDGTNFCPRHGGTRIRRRLASERLRMYHLKQWKKRVEEFSGHAEVKDLHEEIGIVRMMLEETLNGCTDADSLLQHTGRITSMIDKVQTLVATVDKMESRAALSPEILSKLAAEWVQIICVYVTDERQLEELSGRLTASLEHQSSVARLALSGPKSE